MRIYFPIEVKNRELIARIYFAIKCCLKGASVVIGDKNNLSKRLNLIKKGIVFFKSIQPHQYETIRKFRENKFKIVSMDEEGLMFLTNENYIRRFKEDNFKLMDIYFSWGKREKDALLSKFKNYENIIKIVGNVRLDILKKPISEIFIKEAKIIKEKYGNFILLTTKFARHNPIRRGWSTYYMGQKNAGYVHSRHNKEYSIMTQHHEKKNLKEFINFIKKFSTEFPNKKLLLRIHPAEDRSIWVNNLSNLKNIYMSFSSDSISTNSYILASQFVIQSNCTTSLEAFLLGKFSVNFLPYNDTKYEYKIPKLVSKNIFNQVDLINFIKNYDGSETKHLSDDENKILKELANNIFTDSCMDQMFTELKKLHVANQDEDKFSNIFFYYVFLLEGRLRNIYYSLTQRSEYKKGLRKLQKQKIPSMTLQEIIFLKNELCPKINVDPSNIKVSEKYPGFFEFKRQH